MAEEEDECPLCLNPFSSEDALYPLNCPTATCRFNYCVDCITRLQLSASDEYQEASDGSNQLKVQVKCPQCREKYHCSEFPPEVILQAVLLLRQANSLQTSLAEGDSVLSATQLSKKTIFMQSTSLEHLQDAIRRLELYHSEIGKEPNPIPPLDWELWRPVLPATSDGMDAPDPLLTHPKWRDPTLFYGLDELMTKDEQEFVTYLFVQGKVDLLSRGAHILHGILDMSASRTVAQLSSFANGPPPTKAPPVDPGVLQKVRKLYPLPSRMPRCVRMPVYDANSRTKPLRFQQDDKLSLIQIRGAAGRLGLRKGDVVTHVNGEAASNLAEFEAALRHNCDSDETFWLVVNCDEEIAQALHDRYLKMVQAKVHFRKH